VRKIIGARAANEEIENNDTTRTALGSPLHLWCNRVWYFREETFTFWEVPMLLSDPLGKIAREHGAHYDRIRHVLPIFEWIAGESTIRPIAARMLGDVRGGVVLDVGSNVGQNMLHLYRSVGDQGHIVGIDTAHACVQLARRKADARGLDNIHYVVDDAHRYRSDTLFDGILMGYCCNVLTDPALAIAQLLGQLRTGKRLVICDARIPPGLQNTAAEKWR
jgi:SAM-dependent methyltransferase